MKVSKQDYLGNGFEFFVEMFLKSFPANNRIGISGKDYKVVSGENDNGCDGYAKNLAGNSCAVQIKYKSNRTTILDRSIDNLGSMIEEALHEGITYSDDESESDEDFEFHGSPSKSGHGGHNRNFLDVSVST